MAAQQVLNGPAELVEQIFLHLPPEHLLKAKRINQHVKSVIDIIPSLQRKLFLRPIRGKAKNTADIRVNPLLLSATQAVNFTGRCDVEVDALFDHTLDRGSSAMDMLLTQPPATEAVIWYHIRRSNSAREWIFRKDSKIDLHREDGLRLRDVLDAWDSRARDVLKPGEYYQYLHGGGCELDIPIGLNLEVGGLFAERAKESLIFSEYQYSLNVDFFEMSKQHHWRGNAPKWQDPSANEWWSTQPEP